ncbi:MAG: NAD(P)H-dependent glycerol-3-phosphate dehydrogenase [Dethiobacter sp.]|jgi:glycerol-3-phosphate dehydrogenase (NAD(P)+)|nr:MAG: NAD(P)H-dependent glycerol-3-phosphate dehydrogenase [Dethiobacter sp.]
MNIGVIGAGSWGTSLAILLGDKGFNVTLWVRREELLQKMVQARENSDYLPGVTLLAGIKLTHNLPNAVHGKDLIVLAVPSHVVGEIVAKIKVFIQEETVIVNTAKGLAERSLKRLSEVIMEGLWPDIPCKVAILSGPNHAEEVSRFIPTVTVVAANDQTVAEKVQDIFMTPYFRVYTNPDIIGVELGGALKNIIALGAGVCDGLNYGDNTKAALLTRGLVEITRLGLALGARQGTFSGLTGIGDLIVTCTSPHSRNRYVGMMLGKGHSLEEITASMKMVAEGIKTTRAAYELSCKYGVEMPITKEVYSILFQGREPREAVKNLMRRQKKHEIEEIAFD